MLTADARVETERSGRYLVRLCEHITKVAELHPEMQASVSRSDDRAVIRFGWGGRCTLRAEPGVLRLRAEAPDRGSLQRIEERVANRLELFGRHEGLRVAWTEPRGDGEELAGGSPPTRKGDRHMAEAPSTPEPTRTGMPRWVKIFLIVVAVLVVAGIAVFKLSGGQHGPSRHLPGGGDGGTPPASVPAGGHSPPPGIEHG